jgi:hypothetical protein
MIDGQDEPMDHALLVQVMTLMQTADLSLVTDDQQLRWFRRSLAEVTLAAQGQG